MERWMEKQSNKSAKKAECVVRRYIGRKDETTDKLIKFSHIFINSINLATVYYLLAMQFRLQFYQKKNRTK